MIRSVSLWKGCEFSTYLIIFVLYAWDCFPLYSLHIPGCQVHVGAPHQTFTVVFDTGQGDPGCSHFYTEDVGAVVKRLKECIILVNDMRNFKHESLVIHSYIFLSGWTMLFQSFPFTTLNLESLEFQGRGTWSCPPLDAGDLVLTVSLIHIIHMIHMARDAYDIQQEIGEVGWRHKSI